MLNPGIHDRVAAGGFTSDDDRFFVGACSASRHVGNSTAVAEDKQEKKVSVASVCTWISG